MQTETDMLPPQEQEMSIDLAQVLYSISVGSDGQQAGTYVFAGFVYLCPFMLLALRPRYGQLLVHELLSLLQSSDFVFEIFRLHLKPGSDGFGFVSKQKNGDLKHVGFSWRLMQFEAMDSSMQTALRRRPVFVNFKSRYR